MIICIIGGLIAGYSDHANLCKEKKYIVEISVGAVILLIVILISFFILDFSFLVNLVLGTLLAISFGTIISVLFNDIDKSQMATTLINKNLELQQSELVLKEQSDQYQRMLYREREYSANLKQQMQELHTTLLASKKNESDLIDKFEENKNYISKIQEKNNQLELEISKANHIKDNLDSELAIIKSQKKQNESNLAELQNTINHLRANLTNLESTSVKNTTTENLLLEREQFLKKQLEDIRKTAKSDNDIKSKLENDLNAVSSQLDAHKEIQNKNNLALERVKADLERQNSDKAKLDNAYIALQAQQQKMLDELQQTNRDKENLEKELDSSRNSIKWQVDKNAEYRKKIVELETKNKELEQKENFLNTWLEIEVMMKNYDTNKTKTSESYINEYYQKNLFNISLKDKLHKARIKRNDKVHVLNVKITQEDLDNVVYCFNEVKKILAP